MDNADLVRCLSLAAYQHMSSHVTATAELHWRCWWTWDAGAAGCRCREAALDTEPPGRAWLAAVQCHTAKMGQR